MADIALLGDPNRYAGLSTDTKIAATKGDVCYEWDTHDIYFYDGSGTSTGWFLANANLGSSIARQLTANFTTNVGGTYATNDMVSSGSYITFSSASTPGKMITLMSCILYINASALWTGQLGYRLHLYNQTPGITVTDNSAYNLSSADRSKYLGFINLVQPYDLGDTIASVNNGLDFPIQLYTGSSPKASAFYGVLQTIGAQQTGGNFTYYFVMNVADL